MEQDFDQKDAGVIEGVVGKFRCQAVSVKGKFFYAAGEKFYVKGVAYGNFEGDRTGLLFPPIEIVKADFALLAEQGFNTVRTCAVPPDYLLDLASKENLKVMVGLSCDPSVPFLGSRRQEKKILGRVKEEVQSCAKHPAIFCYSVGNEIPASIVRWHGKEKIEAWMRHLYQAVKEAAPEALVSYVNHPATDYLNLNFLDFDCFNLSVEQFKSQKELGSYLLKLHTLSNNRPLVISEFGPVALTDSHDGQVEVLAGQVETIYGLGCAGLFIAAPNKWCGHFQINGQGCDPVEQRLQSKAVLRAVKEAMHAVPCPLKEWPFISVAICSFNGSATIRDTLDALQRLAYPAFEVVVVNDGSTDNLAAVVKEYPVRLITTPNRGLSNARNTAAEQATGEIIAYIDDDAYPDPHWLHYLAYAYANTACAGVGGPNIIPDEDGPIAHCVASTPGGPSPILITSEIAEVIPGCNMSFRRDVYRKMGGCDPICRIAGDDIDLCWRMQEAGYTIGYHPAALVWHHRRNSFKAYWRQQENYGRSATLLAAKWPEKHNSTGHLIRKGRIFGANWETPFKLEKSKFFYGVNQMSRFQPVYHTLPENGRRLFWVLEWYLVAGFLGLVGCLGFFWQPLLWGFVPFAFSVLFILAQAIYSTAKNLKLPHKYKSWKYNLLVLALHLVQPAARLCGRIKSGFALRLNKNTGWSWKFLPVFHTMTFQHWSEKRHSHQDYVAALQRSLAKQQMISKLGGDFDLWDLQFGDYFLSYLQCLLIEEEHSSGKQYLKIKAIVRFSKFGLLVLVTTGLLTGVAFFSRQWVVGTVFGLWSLMLLIKLLLEKSTMLQSLEIAIDELPTLMAS